MSRTLSAPRWGWSAAMAGTLALALMALAILGLAPRANASFTTAKCNGPSISGEGGSFAKDAHGVFNFNFKNSYCPGTSSSVTYAANGSGEGVKSMTLRGRTPRFGQTDDPPTPEQIALINAGATVDPGAGKPVTVADSDPSNDAKVHVVPAAVGAVVALVNLPENCNSKLLLAAHRTDDAVSTADDKLIRVRFSKSEFEQIWAQGASGGPSAVPYLHWDDVLTELNTDSDCDVPIVRVVRFDQSGTTFTFKDYLNSINNARGWKTTFSTTGAHLTRDWPGATFGPRTDCGGTEGPGGGASEATDNLTSGCGNGNGNLVDKLIGTEGSIGYSDLATARNKGAVLNATSGPEAPTTPYWTQVQNGSNEFTEPTADVNGFRTDGSKGANCLLATFTGIPATPASDPTFGNWADASGVNSPNKGGGKPYGICTLTYGLVFDDNSAAWGAGAEEEQKARTVKDYWEGVLSAGVQGQLFPADYAPLPAEILSIARTGIASVDWNKGAGGGGNNNNGGGGNTGNNNGGGSTPPTVKPSNLFTVPRKSISSKTGGATVSVKLPGPGKFELIGTAKAGKKKINVGRVTLTANKAGTFELSLKPSGAAKKQLRQNGSLRVSLELSFTPTGGDEKTSASSLTLKLKQKGTSG